MTTLRRELRLKIYKILSANLESYQSEFTLNEIADYIADAVLKIFYKDKQDENAS